MTDERLKWVSSYTTEYAILKGEEYKVSLKDRLILVWTAMTNKKLIGVVVRK